MSDTVLLTGVTGFLGGHIALKLLSSGYRVRGSLRNPGVDGQRANAVRDTLEKAGADVSKLELAPLDLTKDDGWDAAAAGARYAIHVASPFATTMPRDPDELIAPAIGGVERMFSAAQKAGVERVVMTSSSLAITAGRGADRPSALGPDDWAKPEDGRMNAYATSKVLAERRAWELAEGGPQLAVVNPGFIVGPLLDDDPGVSGAVIQRLLRGELPMVPRLFLHLSDVRDIAEIHVAALTSNDAAGRRHPSAFRTMTLKEISATLAEAFPRYASALPKRQAPDWLVRLLALFDGDIRANVNEVGYAPRLNADRGRALLGDRPIRPQQSLIDMAESLIARQLV